MTNLKINGIEDSIYSLNLAKPDPALRQCAHNQRCYHELMDVRSDVLEYLKSKRWNS